MKSKYFASSNSYTGFHSLFGVIFDSKKFDNVFVLKGGPGTGKSTFIKKIRKLVAEKHGEATLYHCSSDNDSLDGITFTINKKRFAIMDGTSPHERDACFPGVIDEIINLGEGLEYEWIRNQRENALVLFEQKANAYRTAYAYLKLAGNCFSELYHKNLEKFNAPSADVFIADFLISTENTFKKPSFEKGFISSFSKDGLRRYQIKNDSVDRIIKIKGDQIGTCVFLNYMKSSLERQNARIFPFSLEPKLPEAILTSNTLITSEFDGEDHDFDIGKLFKRDKIDSEETRLITKAHDEFLGEAKRWLTIASDIHFRLEKIYTKCMNFEHNEIIFEKTCKKILKVCECDE